jgi:NAD(P)-dependent dehydrogenase (short-subunit alcohol dehydrogenase family)
MSEFAGRTALVTGGTSGIGRAVAEAFAAGGARVVVAARNSSRGLETAGAIERAGGEAWYVRTDVSSLADTEALVRKTLEYTDRLDYAVNAAAVTDPVLAPVTEVPETDFDEMIAVTLKGVWLSMRAEIPALIDQGAGAIVNVASLNGLAGTPLAAHYSAAKHGVIGLSRTAALECAAYGVRINTLCPGPTETPTIERVFDALSPNAPEVARQSYLDRIPIHRLAQPAEIADTVLWLCSEGAANITGAVIASDGGLSAGI